MSAMSRTKGQTGEREAASILRDLTGWDISRRVRQHEGDSDLDGIPGWSAEVKRHATATHAQRAGWWAQAVEQAQKARKLPLLLYRANRADWRAMWPLAVLMTDQRAEYWCAVEYTADTSLQAWAAVAREINA